MSTHTNHVTRLEAFSDAVFAFSATLLVVSLEVPESFADLIRDLHGFYAFALGFLALIMIWTVHYHFFRRFQLADSMIVLWNSLLLFVILFYVYPLKFVTRSLVSGVLHLDGGEAGVHSLNDLSLLFILYSSGFAAIFFCIAFMYRHASGQREMLELTVQQATEGRFYFRHYLILAFVGVVSIVLASFKLGLAFGLPGMIYFILGPLCYWHGRWSARKASR